MTNQLQMPSDLKINRTLVMENFNSAFIRTIIFTEVFIVPSVHLSHYNTCLSKGVLQSR